MTLTTSPDGTPPSSGRRSWGDPPPRPSATLLAHVAKMQPVRPRVPVRSLLIVALIGCAYPAWTLTAWPLRSGLAALSLGWVGAGSGALWLAGFILPLTFAILPGTGQVVPDGKRAFRIAGLTAVVLMAASLLLGVEAPGGGGALTRGSESLASWAGCATSGLTVSAPVILAGTLALRRVAIMQAWRLGAAVGTAGGSLAGLTLHLGCSNGRASHLALAHAGGVVIGAVAGALCLLVIGRANR